MDLSVVVPFYNEEESVALLYEAISKAIRPLGLDYEVVFVDDGSSDRTFSVAAEIARGDPRLRVIKFRRNYGQTPAMAAGIDHARGEIVVTMDGDLQNDPADIPMFIERIRQGSDIVVGWRFDRQDKLLTRKVPSRIANWLIGKVTGVPIKDNGCSLKAFRAQVIRNVPLYSEMHRFIPAMASVAGPNIAEVKVRHHARQFGESKYGLSRVYKVLLDLLTIKTIASFASRPLLWFATLSLPFAIAGMFCLGLTVYYLIDRGDYSLTIASISVLCISLACFLFLGGALAELIYKTGDVKMHKFSALTATMLVAPGEGARIDRIGETPEQT
ncbi:MAG: glycosyltransferase family 2 protein [Gammaproteobacteria bacterium]|nr:glycosyltransferase family 2 protein [Gammaproteobacteria bacterium]